MREASSWPAFLTPKKVDERFHHSFLKIPNHFTEHSTWNLWSRSYSSTEPGEPPRPFLQKEGTGIHFPPTAWPVDCEVFSSESPRSQGHLQGGQKQSPSTSREEDSTCSSTWASNVTALSTEDTRYKVQQGYQLIQRLGFTINEERLALQPFQSLQPWTFFPGFQKNRDQSPGQNRDHNPGHPDLFRRCDDSGQ